MAAKRKNALGRGLGALLEDSRVAETTLSLRSNPVAGIHLISINSIECNPFQPRQAFDKSKLADLAESIKVHGIIQPVTVRKLTGKSYQLISGERRWSAASIAGLSEIPVYVREANDQQMLEMALIENIQRENLNAIEIALSYQRLLTECNLKQEELGSRVGKNRSTVTNYLRLLKLPPDIQAAIRDRIISMGHARSLLGLATLEQQLSVFLEIIKKDLSVRKVESLVRMITSGKIQNKKPTRKIDPSPEILKLQKQLSSHFGSKVLINSNEKNKGDIKIPFISVRDLNRILEILDISL